MRIKTRKPISSTSLELSSYEMCPVVSKNPVIKSTEVDWEYDVFF